MTGVLEIRHSSTSRFNRWPRFSLFALLVFITVFSLVLACGVFCAEKQRKKRERVANELATLRAEIWQKWDEYVAIARERPAFDKDGRVKTSHDLEVRGEVLERLEANAISLEKELERLGGKPPKRRALNKAK